MKFEFGCVNLSSLFSYICKSRRSVSFQCNFHISRVKYYRLSFVAAFHIVEYVLVAHKKQMARSTPLVYVNTGRTPDQESVKMI
jgi:hypothetical protein